MKRYYFRLFFYLLVSSLLIVPASRAQSPQEEWSKAKQLYNEGLKQYNISDIRGAIKKWEAALTIVQKLGNNKAISATIGNLGSAYSNLGDYRKAIEYHEKALAIAEETEDKNGKGTLIGNLGSAYSYLGDYRKAIEYHEKALVIAEEIGDKNGSGRHFGNLGTAYINMGDYRKAIEYHEKALAIAEEIGDKNGRGRHLGNLGLAYSNLGDYLKAIDYHEKALAVSKDIGVPYTIHEGNLGDAYLALNRDEEAFSIYTKQDHPVRLGRYYLKKKDFKEAGRQFDRDREKYEKAKNTGIIIPQWIGLGLSFEGLKDYKTAYKWYTKAIDFLEEQRNGLSPSEREHFFESNELGIPRIEAYEGAVRCAFMLNKLDEAFFWAENTRGRIFSELISGRHSKANYKIPRELAQEEEELANQITMNKRQQQTAFEKNNPELLKQLEAEYPAIKQKMDKLIDRLRSAYPQYAAVRYPQPVKLNQLSLKKGETIIEYEVTDPYTIGLVIKDGKVVKGFRVEKTRAEIETMSARFRSPFQEGNDAREFSLVLAKELMELLLQPALSAVQKGEHLIIIPDEALSLVPFEALLLSAPDNKGGKKTDPVYAIDEYPINYYQSASVLSLRRGLNITRAKDAAFFGTGDPVYDKADIRTASLRSVTIVGRQTKDIIGSQATKESGYTFSRLPNTGKEVSEVGRLFSKNKLLVGPDASEEKVKAEDLSSMRYVLFSTHGILGNEIPYIKQPALVLNLLGNDKEDGFLTAGEIFGMNLNADIVGLSACKTGLGIHSAGEGVTGLSRAFMYAGADSVLVSLWSVADESTYMLMVKFFEGLKAGKDKMTALKDAKYYLRRSGYTNPFYWAPFIIMGEED